METTTLTENQQRSGAVLTQLYAGKITKEDAQNPLNSSRKQANRILENFKERGVESLIHGNCIKIPARKTLAYKPEFSYHLNKALLNRFRELNLKLVLIHRQHPIPPPGVELRFVTYDGKG